MKADKPCDHERVNYRNRSYLVVWLDGHTLVNVDYMSRLKLYSRTVQRGPTRDAVVKLANKQRLERS